MLENMIEIYVFRDIVMSSYSIPNLDLQNMFKIVDHFGHFGTMGYGPF